MNEIRDKESLSLYFERLSELSAAEVDGMDLSPFATKLPRPFFVSAKQLMHFKLFSTSEGSI